LFLLRCVWRHFRFRFQSRWTAQCSKRTALHCTASSQKHILQQEIRSVVLGVCPMQLFFSFDHVTFIQFKICCCVTSRSSEVNFTKNYTLLYLYLLQNFIEIGWFFSKIWRYNDFQNDGRPPSWILEIFIFDHVTFIQFKICCCVQNFMKIGWFFHRDMAIFDLLDLKPLRRRRCPRAPAALVVNSISPFHSVVCWIVRFSSSQYSVMLSSHLFLGLPLGRRPCVYPCIKIFGYLSLSIQVTCPK